MSAVTIIDAVEGEQNELLLDCSFDAFTDAVLQSDSVIAYESYQIEDVFVIATDSGSVRLTTCPTDDTDEIQQEYSLSDFVANMDEPEIAPNTLVISPDALIDVMPFIESLEVE